MHVLFMYIVYHGFVVDGGRSWCSKCFVCGLPALVVLGLWFALLVACLARPASEEEEVSALVVFGLWPAQFVAWLAGPASGKDQSTLVVLVLWIVLYVAWVAGPASAEDLAALMVLGMRLALFAACVAGPASEVVALGCGLCCLLLGQASV